MEQCKIIVKLFKICQLKLTPVLNHYYYLIFFYFINRMTCIFIKRTYIHTRKSLYNKNSTIYNTNYKLRTINKIFTIQVTQKLYKSIKV